MNLYEQAIEKYGKEHQLIVTFGELSECAAEVAKHMIPERKHNEQDLVDELADVHIMIQQAHIIYGERLREAIIRKRRKLAKHIEEDNYEQK